MKKTKLLNTIIIYIQSISFLSLTEYEIKHCILIIASTLTHNTLRHTYTVTSFFFLISLRKSI